MGVAATSAGLLAMAAALLIAVVAEGVADAWLAPDDLVLPAVCVGVEPNKDGLPLANIQLSHNNNKESENTSHRMVRLISINICLRMVMGMLIKFFEF
jgi:hypothetical protein